MKLAVPLLALALTLPAQAADNPPRSITLGGYGVIERSDLQPRTQGRWRGFPISVTLDKAPLQDVVRTLAKIADFNVIFDPRVQGSVTVELKDVPWDQALYLILKTHGMGAEIDGRVWVVTPQ